MRDDKSTATLHVAINDKRWDGNVGKIARAIAIGTEEMPAREGENRARMVSTIEITLT